MSISDMHISGYNKDDRTDVGSHAVLGNLDIAIVG